MTTLQQWEEAQANPEVVHNRNFETLSAAGIFAKKQSVTTALTWGYYGGLYNGNTVADGTVTLTDASDNYVVVLRSTGVVSTSTSSTNSLDTLYCKLYKVTCAGGVVTAVVDQRFDANGLLLSSGGGGGGGGSTQGRHAIYIAAGSMQPSIVAGPSRGFVVTAANQPDVYSLDFDQTTQEFAQFSIVMPKKWNLGTVTFIPHWTHTSGGTTYGVVWGLQAVAFSDGDNLAAAFGTAQTSTDTGGTNNNFYSGPESSVITVSGSPAAQDLVVFRVYRDPASGSDTLDLDARLHGITVFITTNADTDT